MAPRPSFQEAGAGVLRTGTLTEVLTTEMPLARIGSFLDDSRDPSNRKVSPFSVTRL